MANLTLVIDDELLKAARIKALQEGTSVNELCRQAIERYAGEVDTPARRTRDARVLAAKIGQQLKASGASLKKDPLWPGREALYRGRRFGTE